MAGVNYPDRWTLTAGQRAAVVVSLVHSAALDTLASRACTRDVLARTHSHPSHRLDEPLPRR